MCSIGLRDRRWRRRLFVFAGRRVVRVGSGQRNVLAAGTGVVYEWAIVFGAGNLNDKNLFLSFGLRACAYRKEHNHSSYADDYSQHGQNAAHAIVSKTLPGNSDQFEQSQFSILMT